VLARSAAEADAAATVIANAVDVDDPAVRRQTARSLEPDSDLGTLMVTVDVGTLAPDQIATALENGARAASHLIEATVISGAILGLGGKHRIFSVESEKGASLGLWPAIKSHP
jgi:uncharacterized protein